MKLIAIGCSGEEAEGLADMWASLPDSSDLSYVVAQPIAPALFNALAKRSDSGPQLKTLDPHQPPQGGVLYLPPPHHQVIYRDGELHLIPCQQAEANNQLFNSLAVALGRQAVGIVLSGTGSDGVSGLRTLRAAGGVTLAQDPRSAKSDGLPKAAIRAGTVDLVLWPRDIGPLLLRLITDSWEIALSAEEEANDNEYSQIVRSVRQRTAFRLDQYQREVVMQRIARRIGLLGLYGLEEYTDYLKGSLEEAQLLVRDTLIALASPFCESETYRTLQIQLQQATPAAASEPNPGWVEENPREKDDARY